MRYRADGFTILEVLIASVLLLIVFVVSFQMISQTVSRAKQIRASVYTLLSSQVPAISLRDQEPHFFHIERVNQKCEADQEEIFQGARILTVCEGIRVPVRVERIIAKNIIRWELP